MKKSIYPLWLSLGIAIAIPVGYSLSVAAEDSTSDQSRRDRIVVEALMRLDDVDVNADPKLSQAVRRYLNQLNNDPSQLKVIQKLKIGGLSDKLVDLAVSWGANTQSVQAMDLAIDQGSLPSLTSATLVCEVAVSIASEIITV